MQALAELNLAAAAQHTRLVSHSLNVERLSEKDREEVLRYLSERPLQTFGLAGFVRDNGLVSPHNRGTFYACRDQQGRLEGVALIGHFIVFEARSEAAIAAFARTAQQCSDAFLLIGEQADVETFWRYYSPAGQDARLYGRELLFALGWPVAVREAVPGLRLATMADLDVIVPAHAECTYIESGINPLDTDAEGFRARCARRIEMGKTWVWTEGNRLIFKVDVVSDTPDVIYLEGVWVNPEERGKGYGSRCISQLGRDFLQRTGSICILVNEKFIAAQMLYRKASFKFIGYYDTIFLKQKTH
ncbi:MAG TPA: GNAT family N-acetyltransferase [Blastocatellia bacterium]|nr:GNAT family N-acetyltransferase [Blastocatellia bacterium]